MGGDRSSLKYFVEKYGKEEGRNRFLEKSKKISNALKGKPSNRKNYIVSDETKRKISISCKKSDYHSSIRGKKYEDIYGQGSLKKHKTNMKGVFSKSWFIKKYGETEGIKKYEERSKTVSEKSYFKIYNKTNKNNYSKISQELFWSLYQKYDFSKQKVYFAELNNEFSCHLNKCCYDFVIEDSKKVIEFNGDKFHANPLLYKENDTPNPYNKETSKEIWKRDNDKNRKAEINGYDVLVVWESEYKNDKEGIINKCLNFLKN